MSPIEAIADLLMVVHAFYSVFVVFGFVLVLTGMILGWRWIHHRDFRVIHLIATILVVTRVWLGFPCPFSAAEDALRSKTVVDCPLGERFHQALHGFAFRGKDPHRFAVSPSVFAGFVAVAFVLNGFRSRMRRRESKIQLTPECCYAESAARVLLTKLLSASPDPRRLKTLAARNDPRKEGEMLWKSSSTAELNL